MKFRTPASWSRGRTVRAYAATPLRRFGSRPFLRKWRGVPFARHEVRTRCTHDIREGTRRPHATRHRQVGDLSRRFLGDGAHYDPGTIILKTDTVSRGEIGSHDPVLREGDGP